ncbi:MAG TPA: GNAT family N-acetyltransferase [Sulfuricurvum sp.]|nr:GNAT family N-acetyltransferase [Sulfuricurvum sp.]
MNTTLFFLRSSEQKIATNMLPYTLVADGFNDSTLPNIYTHEYGFKNSDIGIYSLTENEISGAAWIRLYTESHGVKGYIDNATPVLIIGVIPDVRAQGIGSLIMDQLLQEAAVMYEQISVYVLSNSRTIKFYEELGFIQQNGVNYSDGFTMVKKLTKKEITRPTDGYDPRRWMD